MKYNKHLDHSNNNFRKSCVKLLMTTHILSTCNTTFSIIVEVKQKCSNEQLQTKRSIQSSVLIYAFVKISPAVNTQQNQASSQAVIIVTQLREKANTRNYKARPQEQLGKKRSVQFHSGRTAKGITQQEQEAQETPQSHCLPT